LKASAYDKMIEPTEYNSKRKHNEEENGLHTPPHRPINLDTVVHTPNKRQMYLEEVVHPCNTTELWKKIEHYLENALKYFFAFFSSYYLVDVFSNLSRKIGERKYIVENLSSLFKFYKATFGNISIDWIESHSLSAKMTKSPTSSGIVKLDAKGKLINVH